MAKPDIHPLTPERWDDLVQLFGPERGAYGGCWCMYWRHDGTQRAFHEGDRAERKRQFEEIVRTDARPPGLIAYADALPVGWVAVGPRDAFPRFNKTKASRLEDGAPHDGIWSVNCFYIDRTVRGRGLMADLLDAAVQFARDHGAVAVDAAPLDVTRKLIAGEGYVGVASVFRAAGFKIVSRASVPRPLMRLVVS
ncbi:MAG: GNAT family N-acetyltransferase [Pseudomonadota bacterium]